MAIRWEAKRPAEVRDYRHDWSAFLDGDTISTSVWSATGVTIDSDSHDTTSATVWLSGGSDGALARLTNTITTAGGRTESETFVLSISANAEPVTLAEAKAHLRITDDAEDALILNYIRAAREWVENYTGHILVRRTFTEYRSAFVRYFELMRRPIVTVASVGYPDTNGDPQSILTADLVVTTRNPVRVYPAINSWWPSLQTNGEITITYTAGYAEGEVPQELAQAILVLTGHFHVNRSAAADPPAAVFALCDHYRSPGL
jgi:uncharacterized phiE125 gp8 family phage protein